MNDFTERFWESDTMPVLTPEQAARLDEAYQPIAEEPSWRPLGASGLAAILAGATLGLTALGLLLIACGG